MVKNGGLLFSCLVRYFNIGQAKNSKPLLIEPDCPSESIQSLHCRAVKSYNLRFFVALPPQCLSVTAFPYLATNELLESDFCKNITDRRYGVSTNNWKTIKHLII